MFITRGTFCSYYISHTIQEARAFITGGGAMCNFGCAISFHDIRHFSFARERANQLHNTKPSVRPPALLLPHIMAATTAAAVKCARIILAWYNARCRPSSWSKLGLSETLGWARRNCRRLWLLSAWSLFTFSKRTSWHSLKCRIVAQISLKNSTPTHRQTVKPVPEFTSLNNDVSLWIHIYVDIINHNQCSNYRLPGLYIWIIALSKGVNWDATGLGPWLDLVGRTTQLKLRRTAKCEIWVMEIFTNDESILIGLCRSVCP